MPVPTNLQSRLWSKSTNSIDIDQSKTYIIEQILCYGTLTDLKWLLDTYPVQTVREIYAGLKPNLHPSITNFVNIYLKVWHG